MWEKGKEKERREDISLIFFWWITFPLFWFQWRKGNIFAWAHKDLYAQIEQNWGLVEKDKIMTGQLQNSVGQISKYAIKENHFLFPCLLFPFSFLFSPPHYNQTKCPSYNQTKCYTIFFMANSKYFSVCPRFFNETKTPEKSFFFPQLPPIILFIYFWLNTLFVVCATM